MINKYPIDVNLTLKTLGTNISQSRRARQLTQQELADRSGISRGTMIAIENGSTDVAIGNFLSVLWAMDIHHEFKNVISNDTVGADMMINDLPKRVRRY